VKPERDGRALVEALVVSALVTAVVAGGALFVPKRYVATFVGFVFLAAVWRLVWTREDDTVKRFGVALGGLMLHDRMSATNIAREALRAAAWAAALGVVFFVPFYFGWRAWWHPQRAFAYEFHALDLGNDALGQLLLVALPEEAFYRGYLQTRLDDALPTRVRVLGASVGPSVVVTSAIFALGHFATIPAPARFAVFFPSIVFGFLRARTGGVGASIAFHAMCNVFSETLGRAYGVY